MIKVAITGNIASGKSAVEKLLSAKGFTVYDTDKIAHELLENSNEVRESFKDFDIYTDNKIDRKKLGKIVFTIPFLAMIPISEHVEKDCTQVPSFFMFTFTAHPKSKVPNYHFRFLQDTNSNHNCNWHSKLLRQISENGRTF